MSPAFGMPRRGERLPSWPGIAALGRGGRHSPDGRPDCDRQRGSFGADLGCAGGVLLRQLRGHTGPVYSVSFSPDGQTLVTASGDRAARLWETHKGRMSSTLRGHTQAVHSAFSRDGSRVVTTGRTARCASGMCGRKS